MSFNTLSVSVSLCVWIVKINRREYFDRVQFITLLLIPKFSYADGGLVAFYKLGTVDGSIETVKKEIYVLLEKESFEIIGEYHPAKNSNLLVITFTNKELLDICKQVSERGLMAAVMRVGLISINGQVEISLLNPEYLFYAYDLLFLTLIA